MPTPSENHHRGFCRLMRVMAHSLTANSILYRVRFRKQYKTKNFWNRPKFSVRPHRMHSMRNIMVREGPGLWFTGQLSVGLLRAVSAVLRGGFIVRVWVAVRT